MILALVLAAATSAAVQEGLADLEAERYEDAVRRLEAAPDLASSYEGLLGLAIARGRLGGLEAAEAPLEAAVHLDPKRPEARIERGGLRFLQGRHADAVRDLRAALQVREDAYARDLLASSLLLLERPLDAVEAWNPLGQPRLRRLTLQGLAHTRDRVARRELRLREGERLEAGDLRASLRALEETGVFSEVVVRASVVQDRELDLELLLGERHGFGQPIEIASGTLANLLVGRVRLRYANLRGHGIGVGAFYRWEGARPRLETAIDWPRPFGLPFQWRLSAYRERQPYALDAPLLQRARGIESTFRRVLGGWTVGEVGLRWRRRSFDRPAPFATGGTLVTVALAGERRLLDTPGERLDVRAEGLASPKTLGSDIPYTSVSATIRYRLGPRESRLAARALVGWGDARMPLDQMYAVGTAPDAEYPLRGHRLRRDGQLGRAPIGRELGLVNLEWRRELWGSDGVGLGIAIFQDVARLRRGVTGPNALLFDAGVSFRVRAGTNAVFRADYGRSLTDGGSVLTIAVGDAF